MKILLLCGSVAQKSHTNALLHYIESLFSAKDCEVTFWDLKSQPLRFVIPEYHKNPEEHPDETVRQFVNTVEDADIIILGSPLYHGSYSGVLKNALDNLRWDAFRGKWIGLVGNAGSTRASHTEFSHLRHVVNTISGYTAQTQVATSRDDYKETENAFIIDNKEITDRCERLVTELLSLTS